MSDKSIKAFSNLEMSVSIENLFLEVLPHTNPKTSKPLVTSSFVSTLIAFIDCVPV